MRAIDVLKSPLHLAELATGAKSFIDNPILGSPRLNGMGLHVARIRLAERMADARRRGLARLVDKADAEAYDRDGYVVKRNFLPDDVFRRLSEEVENASFEAHEMKGGDTVTRFIALPPRVLAGTPELSAVVNGAAIQGLLRYVASTSGDPMIYLHAVITDPGKGAKDPQTAFHSDTFHPTAKCWFFLRDVEIEDGPFTFVPGSHRLTPGRLEWERRQSLDAWKGENRIHSRGSFRATADELRAMGYGDPVPLPVPANTLVVADTHGFHARAVSTRPSVRLGIYGSLRRNPFLPWTGGDPLAIPALRNRKAAAYDVFLNLQERLTGKPSAQPSVGMVRPGDPARR